MSKEKLGQEPAFPVKSDTYGNCGIESIGMSKRFYAACAAMQGLLYLNSFKDRIIINSIVTTSYEIADELLKQENL